MNGPQCTLPVLLTVVWNVWFGYFLNTQHSLQHNYASNAQQWFSLAL